MGVRTVEHRMCDRPGCDNRVTDKGLVSAGLSTHGVGQVVNFASDDPQAPAPPDLCRECTGSLATWWTGIDRRRMNASAGGDSSDGAETPRAKRHAASGSG